jgi:hypothetical protein
MLIAAFFAGFVIGYIVFAAQVVRKFMNSVGEPEYKWGSYLVKVRRG